MALPRPQQPVVIHVCDGQIVPVNPLGSSTDWDGVERALGVPIYRGGLNPDQVVRQVRIDGPVHKGVAPASCSQGRRIPLRPVHSGVAQAAALDELRAAARALRDVPSAPVADEDAHPARAAALQLVSEHLNCAVRLLGHVDGYPAGHQTDRAVSGRDDERSALVESVDQGHKRLVLDLELDAGVVQHELGHDSSPSAAGGPIPAAEPTVTGGGDSPAAASSPAAGHALHLTVSIDLRGDATPSVPQRGVPAQPAGGVK